MFSVFTRSVIVQFSEERWNSEEAALPDFATWSNLNAVKFLTRRDNLVIKPTIGLLSSLSDLKHIQHARLSLVVLELTEVEIFQNREIWQHSEEGNTS